jgi:[ribosomal protein S18]-alanine N-acetyltransferase
MSFRKAQVSRPIAYLTIMKRILKDTLGVFLLKGWKQTDKEKIVLVDDYIIHEVIKIHSESFQDKNEKDIIKYSKSSRKIFYVAKSHERVVGYCIYYLKPVISSGGFKKQAVICSIAIDRNFRGKGIGKKLLKESIKEMRLNKISSIILYVSKNNVPAIRLYEKMGFLTTGQIENICGQKEKCYKMELKLF